jgi:hypothetical protein
VLHKRFSWPSVEPNQPDLTWLKTVVYLSEGATRVNFPLRNWGQHRKTATGSSNNFPIAFALGRYILTITSFILVMLSGWLLCIESLLPPCINVSLRIPTLCSKSPSVWFCFHQLASTHNPLRMPHSESSSPQPRWARPQLSFDFAWPDGLLQSMTRWSPRSAWISELLLLRVTLNSTSNIWSPSSWLRQDVISAATPRNVRRYHVP